MYRSLLKCFPLFIWLLFAVSSVSHFRPDTGWRRWSLVQVRWFSPAAGRAGAAGRHRCVCGALAEFRPHWVCPAQGCLRFPRLHCSGSRLLYMEQALRCVRFQFWGPPQKHGLGWACVLCLSRPEQLRQPGACRAHSPWARRAFSPPRPQPQFLCPPVRCALCLFSGAGL